MADRPTFSPFWHRVRALKVRLRPHVQVTRQRYRGQRWHVAHDPASNQFYRLAPIAHEYVGLLDGRRTVEEVWHIVLERHADAAPTQQEVIQLLSQLYQGNLLSADMSPETEQLLQRGRERVKKKVIQQAMGIMYFKMRMFNPDGLLTLLEPIFRPLMNWVGLLAWAAFVVFAFAQLVPHWDALVGGAGSVIAPKNWGWLIVVFVVTKLIHEMGHGLVCKSLGLAELGRSKDGKPVHNSAGLGQVPEVGIMMLVLFPAPYVDASSAWALPGKWARIAVGAAGMIFELFVAGIAALVWVNSPESGLWNQLAYNAIFMASVSTVLFNANPLMRFDGYFILSDLLEIPNLMQRSTDQLKYFFQKYIYRIESAKPPTSKRGEAAILYTYGTAAMVYRVFLFVSITLYVMGRLFVIGLLLAIWTAAMWFIMPLGKLVGWLASGSDISDKRGRVIATTLGMIAVCVVGVGVIPAPDWRRARGVVESVSQTPVYISSDGFVTEALVRPGDRVEAGDVLLVGRSPELVAEIARSWALLAETESVGRGAQMREPAAADVSRQRAKALRERIGYLEERAEALTIRAPHDGVFVGGDPAQLVGSYAQRGQFVGEVVDPDHLRVAAVLSQTESAWHFELGGKGYEVEIRKMSDPEWVLVGSDVTVIEAGQTALPHGALGYAGGGNLETDAENPLIAKEPMFVMRVGRVVGMDERDGGEVGVFGTPGERVSLRFTLPSRPLLFQWVDRLHKMVQGRVQL